MLTQVTKAREQADQVDHSANEKKEGNYLIMCWFFKCVYIFDKWENNTMFTICS